MKYFIFYTERQNKDLNYIDFLCKFYFALREEKYIYIYSQKKLKAVLPLGLKISKTICSLWSHPWFEFVLLLHSLPHTSNCLIHWIDPGWVRSVRRSDYKTTVSFRYHSFLSTVMYSHSDRPSFSERIIPSSIRYVYLFVIITVQSVGDGVHLFWIVWTFSLFTWMIN